MADGVRVLITGGASGIGAATARAFAREGAKVAVCDLNVEGASAIAEEVGGVAVSLDVTDTASVRACVARVVDELGGIDTLVNCAGWDKIMPFVESDEELWDLVAFVKVLPSMSAEQYVALDSRLPPGHDDDHHEDSIPHETRAQ